MTESPLQTETTGETTTFEHFGRTWTVPTQRHLSHLVKLRDAMNQPYGDADVVSAEIMLGPEQFSDLLKIDPDEKQLGDFVKKIVQALGLGADSGNS